MNKKLINQNFIIRISQYMDGRRKYSRLVGFDTLKWIIGNESRFQSILNKAWNSGRDIYRKKITDNHYVEFITRK